MKTFISSLKSAFGVIAFMWLVFLVDLVLPINLKSFGIHPHSIFGLIGIITCPFLHANLGHIIANSMALLPLLTIAFFYDRARSIGAMSIIVLAGGLGVWLFGSAGVHIGASGLVFGLIGYLLFVGIYFRDIKAIVVSVIVLLGYGGSLFSLLIVMPGISWSGHFFGFLGGVLAAKLAKRRQ